jgi:uncharacterized protein involved in exopolysaccharide biosynthesis
MDTGTVFRALRSFWYLPAIGMLAGAAVAAFLSGSATPVYEASATYVVFPAQADVGGINDTVRTIDDPRSRAVLGTYVEVLNSESVAAEAAVQLALDPAVLEDYEVRAVVLPEANVVELTVTGPNPGLLPSLAEAAGSIGSARFIALYGVYQTLELDSASVPTEPVNLGPVDAGILGAAAGLLAGGLLALVIGVPRERRRREVLVRIDSYGDRTGSVTPFPSAYDRRSTGTG